MSGHKMERGKHLVYVVYHNFHGIVTPALFHPCNNSVKWAEETSAQTWRAFSKLKSQLSRECGFVPSLIQDESANLSIGPGQLSCKP